MPSPRVGWIPKGNHRGTLSLVWSCVFTIFIFPAHFAKRAAVSNDVFVAYGFSTNLCSLFLTLFGVVYVGMHCTAWNFSVPMSVEQTFWRIANATATVLPVVLLGSTAFLETYDIYYEFKMFNKVFDMLKLE
jgi:hypothetical protein